jgi:hypothetical protein
MRLEIKFVQIKLDYDKIVCLKLVQIAYGIGTM